jgi:hypothetical protein
MLPMTEKNTLDFELPNELIQQYMKTFASLSDFRLLILLLFNSFEEIIKSFAAWRLTCPTDKLPFKNNPNLLIEVVLAGSSIKEMRKRIEKFRNLRNSVAHKFHLNEYKQNLKDFIESNSNKPCPQTEPEKRKALIEAFCDLTLDIAGHISDISPRGDWPFPFLSIELSSHRG